MTLPQRTSRIKAAGLAAIDVHVHAMTFEATADPAGNTFGESASKYFGAETKSRGWESIGPYYRERGMAAVIFSVDEPLSGAPFLSNSKVVSIAAEHPDILIPFASVNPHRGPTGVEEVKRLIAQGAICGFKFHPPLQ